MGEIVVTGSRIPRANLTAPTAVTTIDAEVINQSGLINVADILRAVPSFGVSALSSANSNFLTTSSGINTLQLRNLEEDRTLVLVNGRRYVSGVAGSAAVDFNTIPTELIERVEIITGGASAIYGSDALAGVINVILRDDFEGVKFGYQYGEADAGGEIENRFNFTAGGDFADGRGNAVVQATYTDQERPVVPPARQHAGRRRRRVRDHRSARHLPELAGAGLLELLGVRTVLHPDQWRFVHGFRRAQARPERSFRGTPPNSASTGSTSGATRCRPSATWSPPCSTTR